MYLYSVKTASIEMGNTWIANASIRIKSNKAGKTLRGTDRDVCTARPGTAIPGTW